MPCEGCKVQFTVFRRKRICSDCKRYFCSNCLTSKRRNNSNVVLCERCAIFAKRPLLKVDLAKLKPKDLIFYLQSKHICTTGCVEKDELVGLVLNHVNANEPMDSNPVSGSSSFSGPSQGEDNTNSFDNIKHTCRNFFTSITDRVDLNFDTKSEVNDTSSHISDQPRVSVREIPSYSSVQNQQEEQKSTIGNVSSIRDSKPSPTQTKTSSTSTASTPTASGSYSSQLSSPVISLASICSSQETSSHSQLSTNGASTAAANENKVTKSKRPTKVNKFLSTIITETDAVSGCECSDDEVIECFNSRRTSAIQNNGGVLSADRLTGQQSTATNTISATSLSSSDNQVAGPSGCQMTTTASSAETANNTLGTSVKIKSLDESSGSSFEDIGAIGGGGGSGSATAADNLKMNENWQFVQKTEDISSRPVEENNESLAVAVMAHHQEHNPMLNSRPKRVTRRRSDGYLSRRHYRDEDVFMANPILIPNNNTSLDEQDEENVADTEEENNLNIASTSEKHYNRCESMSKCCKRCGKTKSSIKKRVAKLQQQLEDTQMSEEDIRHELEEFLHYLENRSKSMDYPYSEETVTLDDQQQIEVYPEFYDGNEGINVYPDRAINSRFINLEQLETIEEIQNLSVKQLKEVLMLNRVDYKGCCEKQELLERVIRLWSNLKSCPDKSARYFVPFDRICETLNYVCEKMIFNRSSIYRRKSVEKLQSDELCKICMDAPIECVILECGHMATCTNCGKVLSECPICRQYIVRVVRFFRA